MHRAAAKLEQSDEIFLSYFYFTALLVRAVLGLSLKRQNTYQTAACAALEVVKGTVLTAPETRALIFHNPSIAVAVALKDSDLPKWVDLRLK